MPKKRFVIDADSVKNAGDIWALVEPLYLSVSIYDGADAYEQALLPYSRPQRALLAVHWYRSEVLNGGHGQFFYNATGVVWPDALEGLRAANAAAHADILVEALARFAGAAPSREQEERQAYLEEASLDFDDLDDRFYGLDSEAGLDATLLAYARGIPSAFAFDGFVEH